MQRQEPMIGATASSADWDSGPAATTRATARKPEPGLTWKIAIGVFLGLALFSAATWIGTALMRTATRQQGQQVQQITAMSRATNRARSRQVLAYYALRPGERCVDGKRLRRIENGWVQVERPCR